MSGAYKGVVYKEVPFTALYLLTQNFLHKHGETEVASNVYHRLAGSHYTVSPAEPTTIT